MALALASAGIAPEPTAAWVARVCELFSCTPTEALQQPRRLTNEVLEARAFKHVWTQIEQGEVPPDNDFGRLVAELYVETVVKPQLSSD